MSSSRQRPEPTLPRTLVVAVAVLLMTIGLGMYLRNRLPIWVASQVRLRPATMVLKPDLGGGAGSILGRLLRGRLKVSGEVWVDNQTWFDIEIKQLRWAAILKSRKVAEGNLEPGPELLSDREDKVSFHADVLLASLGLAAVDLLKVGSADVYVDVAYTASILGMTFSNSIRLSGFDLRMDAKQIPLDQLIREPSKRDRAADQHEGSGVASVRRDGGG